MLQQVATDLSSELLSGAAGDGLEAIGIIYLDLVETLVNRLKSGSLIRSSPDSNRVGKNPKSETSVCPLCNVRRKLELAYLEDILRSTVNPDFVAKCMASDDLFAIHLIALLKLPGFDSNKRALASTEVKHLEDLARDV